MSVELTNTKALCSRNPANMQVLGEVKVSTGDEVLSAVDKARKAFQSWSTLTLKKRLGYLDSFREALMAKRDDLATLITCETGKPLIESYGGELFGPLETVSWLKENAPRLLKPQPVKLNPVFFLGKRSYNLFEPFGVVAVISPWNYAFAIPVCTILTALAAGNTVVIKPSPKTPLISCAMANLFAAAGFPEGVVSVVFGDKEQARALVLSDVDRVVFTGSVGGGKAIMGLASEKLHPVTMELGGKHPAIVLEDIDVERVARAIVWCAFTNAGQACASIERLYVMRPVADKLSCALAELTKGLRLGNGLEPDIDVGPVIDGEQLERVAAQVDDAVSSGAELLAGGHARLDLGGFFFEPTVLMNVTESMRVIREETFGPVLPIVVVDDVEEAIRYANNSTLGLGASVWTSDSRYGEALTRRIQAGMVWVNDGLYSHSCPDAPWGGIKNSGFGRVHGAMALYDFVHIKHIGVDSQGARDWHFPYSRERLDLIKSAMEMCHGGGIVAKLKALLQVIPNWLKIRKG